MLYAVEASPLYAEDTYILHAKEAGSVYTVTRGKKYVNE